MKRACVDYAVLLAVDTDPSDVEKPEIKSRLRQRHLDSLLGFRALRFASIEDEIKQFFQGLIAYYPELKSSNQEIADLVKRNPDKFIGFGSVNPNKDEDYVEGKLEEISTLGFKGIKMLLYHTGCDPGPWEIPEISEDANPKYLKPVLERYNPVIVLAHTGSYSAYKPGIWFDEAFELGKNFDNVYFDSAAVSSFIYSEKILKRIREEVGLDRLLYGSDYPVVWGTDMESEVGVIKRCKYLTEDEKKNILGLNAAKILNL
jgi:predicted TIM-barrel fold metal-dependent hydrolase